MPAQQESSGADRKPSGGSLLVVEHRLATGTHATVNAAFLLGLRQATTNARIVFASDPRHAAFVGEVLRCHGAGFGSPGLEFRPLMAPRPGSAVDRTQYLRDKVDLLRTLALLRREVRPSGMLFCSSAAMDPLILGRFLGRSVPMLVVVHELNRLTRSSRRASPLRYALKGARTRALRFVVLGPSVLAGLRLMDPPLARRFCAIPLPCLVPVARNVSGRDTPRSHDSAPVTPGTGRRSIRFGRLGGDGRGGATTFLEVVHAVRQRTSSAAFVMVGSTGFGAGGSEAGVEIEGYSETPLSYAEYCRRGASLDYAIWVGDPSQYQLTISASLIDAVAFGKPLIALRNPFTEWLFDTFGAVGCLCSGTSDMVEAIVSRAETGMSAVYGEEVDRLRLAQEYFAAPRVGEMLCEEFKRLGRAARTLPDPGP